MMHLKIYISHVSFSLECLQTKFFMMYTSGYFRQHVKLKDYELRGRILKSESFRNFFVNIILNSTEGFMMMI